MLCSLHLIIIKDLSAQVGGNAIYIIMIFPYGHASYFFICYTFIVHLMFRLVCQYCLSITNNQLLYILGVYIMLKLFLF